MRSLFIFWTNFWLIFLYTKISSESCVLEAWESSRVRKNTIKIRFRSDEINLTPFCQVWSETGSDFFRPDTRYLESDPKNYLFSVFFNVFWVLMHSLKKCLLKMSCSLYQDCCSCSVIFCSCSAISYYITGDFFKVYKEF